MDESKRRENERKFPRRAALQDGGRRYFYEIRGRLGWTAQYVKEVDANEVTLRFYQEIYDEQGELFDVHEKFPVDKGHQKVKSDL